MNDAETKPTMLSPVYVIIFTHTHTRTCAMQREVDLGWKRPVKTSDATRGALGGSGHELLHSMITSTIFRDKHSNKSRKSSASL